MVSARYFSVTLRACGIGAYEAWSAFAAIPSIEIGSLSLAVVPTDFFRPRVLRPVAVNVGEGSNAEAPAAATATAALISTTESCLRKISAADHVAGSHVAAVFS